MHLKKQIGNACQWQSRHKITAISPQVDYHLRQQSCARPACICAARQLYRIVVLQKQLQGRKAPNETRTVSQEGENAMDSPSRAGEPYVAAAIRKMLATRSGLAMSPVPADNTRILLGRDISWGVRSAFQACMVQGTWLHSTSGVHLDSEHEQTLGKS